MRVLLTGVGSFLGGHLAEHLLRAGIAVVATYRSWRPELTALSRLGALELVQLDLADEAGLAALPPAVDAVVHVAGVSVTPATSVEAMIGCNVAGMRNVVHYALASGASRLIYTSSLSIHGQISVPVVDEATTVLEPDLYGVTKYFGERLLASVGDRLPGVAIRLPGVLGRGAHRAWIPTLLERIRAGREISIYNPEAPFNNAAHADDLGRFCMTLLAGRWSGFAAMPVGAAGTISVRAVVERLMAAAGKRVAVQVGASAQPGFVVSSQRAISGFGYDPMPIGDMVDRYVADEIGNW